ncbi:MAG: hypothetical protein ACTHKK_12370 [Candidatus Nitrosocosmicus sp.]
MNSNKLIFITIALVLGTTLVTSTVVSFEPAHATHKKNPPTKNNNFSVFPRIQDITNGIKNNHFALLGDVCLSCWGG